METQYSHTLGRQTTTPSYVCVCVYMCVYYESQCMDRCLQWSWVICLHYTTTAQPSRAIIYSDLPKHTHPETGSPTCWRQDPLHKAMVWAYNGPFWSLGALDAIQHPNRDEPRKAFLVICVNINTHSDTAAHHNIRITLFQLDYSG